MITSVQHPLVKEATALKQRKYREKANSFCLEGVRLIEEALASDLPMVRAFYHAQLAEQPRGARLLQDLVASECNVQEVDQRVLLHLSDTQSPQGIVVVASAPQLSIARVVDPSKGLVLILDRVQDPGNVGTILRTAEAAGVGGIVLLSGSVDVYSPKVLRAAMGAVFRMPVVQNIAGNALGQWLATSGFRVVAADIGGSQWYFECDLTGPVALLMGNEGEGLSEQVRAMASEIVKIPMQGQTESLNVGVATAVLLYEAVRQRCLKGSLSL